MLILIKQEEHVGLPLNDHEFDTVVVRFGGEIGIKATWTRKLYERRLATNIKATLKKHAIAYTGLGRRFGRLYVKTTQAEETADKLRRVFGVSSLSPAMETTSNLNYILNVSVRLAGLRFKKGKSFAVNCRRVGKHPYTSQDVCQQVGHSILTQLPQLNLQVDLTCPEQTLNVEVREDKAYVFTNTVKGVGGLPLGTQPKLACLLKGDASSAVACWMTMKRGCPSILVYFADCVLGKQFSVEKAMDAAKRLMEWSAGFPRKLYVIESGENLQKLTQKRPKELGNLLCKRLMLQVAQGVVRMKNAEGIVLGDSIEKEANKTLHAFRIQDEAVKDYPVYRPLLGLDSNEIEELAQKISLEKTGHEVRSKAERKEAQTVVINLEDIEQIEKELTIEKIVEDALKSMKVLQV
jgi:thiamine biosynthesis protein ThiI